MTWMLLPESAGVWTVRVDGEDVGTFSLLDTAPSTGRALFPSVRAGHIAAAMNDFDHTVTVDRYRLAGWGSSDEYHAQVEAIKDLTTSLPAVVRAEIATAWARHGWQQPISRDQMTIWQDEVLEIAARDGEVAA